MNGDIVEVPFNGSMMIAQRFDDGEIYAALKPICENIGIAYNGQWERLKRTPWATVRIIRTVGAGGKQRDMVAISRKTLTMWLATIDTNRLSDEQARHNVTVYQKEAAEALDKYFNEGGAIRVSDADSDEDIMARAVLVAQKTIKQKNQQIAEQQTRIVELEPKARFADAVAASDGTCLVGELAKMLRQNGMDIGQNRLFRLLQADGYLGKSGSNRNVPTQRAMDLGLFRIKETTVTHADGHTTVSRTPKVTGKGQRYFIDRYWGRAQPSLEAGA
ncbi:phage antirepressor KilAC domain-containing protein [Bifidobacterium adolescentis]|uniref:phage antirepressor KilAC domain-containing protein n=1 Tax=Bifidobacterium adolescentis TaxID=1680 RepID=UPI003BB5CFD7